MFCEEVESFGSLFEVVDFRPMCKAGAFLGFQIVLNVYEQIYFLAGRFRLPGWAGRSGDPCSNGFLRIIDTQCFQAGKPFLSCGSAGNIFAPLDFVSLCLQPFDKLLKGGYLGYQSVNGGFQFCLIAGSRFFGSMLNIALSFVLPRNDNGQAIFFAQPVAGAADEMIAAFVGMIFPIIYKADGIKNDVIMDMAFVYVCCQDKFIL